MPSGAGVGPRGFASRRSFRAGVVAAAMLLAAVLASVGLSHQLFWDDEANTAIYARNLLKFGRLTAWDGVNLVGYSYGGALGADLGRELRVPPLPAYVAAAGLFLLGGNTFKELTLSGRIPFVVAGVLSIGLLAIWLRRHFGRRFPWHLPPLILALSPAYLLYIRNCRYYALGVMLTLAVWVFWAPGSSRGPLLYGSVRELLAWLFRCLGAAAAMVLLIFTHYLNAASVLVTLPLFFLDRRYRQPKQHVLLGVIYAAAVVCGLWIRFTADPFAAEYQTGGDALDRWRHFYTNAWWFLRDLGTHEFIPWVVVAALLLPWLPLTLRRLRPLARRAWILVALVLVYAVLAALFTPADMGKGPTAEMRYVVPLIAVGSVLGGLALVILWRWYRPLAAAGLVLLVATNTLHLGFLANRSDGASAWWPPTLYRYVQESFHDYETGNEEMIGILDRLPAGTTVRVWPTVMIYPAMFYVPRLHYCDQLSAGKKVDPELEPLPDYLYRERARPDVIFVAPHLLLPAMDELGLQADAASYQVTKALARHLAFMCKPEIPNHFFSYPKASWQNYPGMIVLLNCKSAVGHHPALRTDVSDAEAICRWGLALFEAEDIPGAIARMREAVRVDPKCRDAHYHLGRLLTGQGETKEAIEHFQAAVSVDPQFAEGHLNLGAALYAVGETDRARFHFQKALELRPRWPAVYFNLGKVFMDQGARPEAIRQFRQALKLSPNYASARVELGIVLFLQGEVDEAIAQYRRALRSEPNHVEAHANLGIALRARAQALEAEGETHQAEEFREEAVAELGEALKRVPPKHALAAEISQMLYEELQEASQRKPPDRPLAEEIRQILEQAKTPQTPKR
jgi:tetratricopeptide (TPR) repeat protein